MPVFLLRILCLACCMAIAFGGNAQGLDLTNLFRPRFELYGDRSDPLSSNNTPLKMEASQRVGIGVFIPFKSKIAAEIDFIKLLSANFKEVAKPKMYQVFGSLRAEYAQRSITADSTPAVSGDINSQRFSAGITGIHIRKKLSLFFYSIAISQNSHTKYTRFDPQVTALAGKVSPRSLKLAWVYGVVAGRQSAGKGFLLPFGGASFRILPKFSANIIIPAQLKVRYRFNRKSYVDAGTWINGERLLLNVPNAGNADILRLITFRNGAQWQYRVSRSLRTFLAAGVEAPVRMSINNVDGTYQGSRFFIRASVQFNIGSGLVDSGKLDFGL